MIVLKHRVVFCVSIAGYLKNTKDTIFRNKPAILKAIHIVIVVSALESKKKASVMDMGKDKFKSKFLKKRKKGF